MVRRARPVGSRKTAATKVHHSRLLILAELSTQTVLWMESVRFRAAGVESYILSGILNETEFGSSILTEDAPQREKQQRRWWVCASAPKRFVQV